MTRIVLCSVLPCVLLLGACASDAQLDRAEHFGDAVRNNVKVQVADPDAPKGGPQTAEGAQVAGAQQRYETDKVKKPVDVSTKSGSSGGGSSGSSND